MTATEKHRVSLTEKFAYAAPAFALAVVGIPVYVYIPKFYTDVVGINISVLGYLMFSVRIFDAVTDPLLGNLSDAWHSKHGRRHPFMYVAALPLGFFFFLLFSF